MLAYKFVPHVRARILKFLDPSTGAGVADTFQVDTALESFLSGGWFGKGTGRRHRQADPAGRAHRLHLRRDR